MCTDEVKKIKNVVREAVALKQELLSTCGSVCPPVRLLVDNATPYQLAVTLQEQGECQGCITPEGSMLQSRLLRAGEAANLFLHTHTQEPYVYENAKRMIDLAHPALPMVNVVQPGVAARFYGNETLNEVGATARFVPYFYNSYDEGWSPYSVPHKGIFDDSDNGFSDSERSPFVHYNKVITTLLDVYHTQNKNAQRYQVTVEPAALRLVSDFEKEIRDDVIPDMPEAARPCLLKAHGQAVRFAWGIHAWNHELPHTVPVTGQEMEQAIELVSATIEHIRYAYDPCGLQAYLHAQKILESLYRITDRWEQDKLLNEGIDSSTIQRRTKINAENTNNALHLLDRHKYLAVYDDATANLKVVLHPDFFEVNRYRQRT